MGYGSANNAVAQQKRESGQQSNRSRSSSRRDRRKRIREKMDDGTYMKTNSLEALGEADANNEMNSMQAFERIGPDSTTMARAERGEIPVRGSNPKEPYYMTPEPKAGGGVRTTQRDGQERGRTDSYRRAISKSKTD